MLTLEKIQKKLENTFHPTELKILDFSESHKSHFHSSSDAPSHLKIIMTSAAFKGHSKVKQHRMVFEVLQEEMKDLHALTLSLKSA